jgi:membrane-associated protease RseP (regulator of RpoE activity)
MRTKKKTECRLGILILLLGVPTWLGAVEPEKVKIKVASEKKLVDCDRLSLKARPFLGVDLTELSPELRRHFGAPEGFGLLISRVEPQSPADRAGLKVGDILLKADGEELDHGGELRGVLGRQLEAGPVTLEILRAGQRSTFRAELEERERCVVDVGRVIDLNQLKAIADIDDRQIEGAIAAALAGLQAIPLDELREVLPVITGTALREGLGTVRDLVNDPEWQEQLRELREVDVEQLQQEMEHLRSELKGLEARLRAETGKAREEIERELAEHEKRLRAEVEKEIEKRRQELRERKEKVKGEGGGNSY